MNLQSLNSFLLLFLIGLFSALFHCYILRRELVGRLIAALIVGWLGAFSGYFAGSFLPLNGSVLKWAALGLGLILAQLLLVLLSTFSNLKDY